jgi:hypothetical protein
MVQTSGPVVPRMASVVALVANQLRFLAGKRHNCRFREMSLKKL